MVTLLAIAGVSVLTGALALVVVRRRRRVARRLYREHLERALEDGILTPEESHDLSAIQARTELSNADVHMVAVALYRRALNDVVADARVTTEEDEHLRRLRDQLGLSDADLASDRRQLQRVRLLAAVERGELPDVPALVPLVPDERCHWAVRATLCRGVPAPGPDRASRGASFDVADSSPFQAHGPRGALDPDPAILPQDLGSLLVTSRRTIFRGAKRRLDLPHARLRSIALYADGLVLEGAAAPGTHVFLVQDPELTGAILLPAARRRHNEVHGHLPAEPR